MTTPATPKKPAHRTDVPEWVRLMQLDCRALLRRMAIEIGNRDMLITELEELLQAAWKKGWRTGIGQR